VELGRRPAGEQVLRRHQQRWVLGDAGLAADLDRELGQRPQVVLRVGLLDGPLDGQGRPRVGGPLEAGHQVGGVEPGVPDVEAAPRGEVAHGPAVLGHRGGEHRPALGVVEAALPPGHGQAGGQALDVPLPGARQRLVEVVDREHEVAFGRAEPAEVGQVGVAARLHPHPRDRGGGQVGSHDRRRAAEERERRRRHPPVPDRHQLGDPAAGLVFEDRDRVGAPLARLPRRVGGAGHPPAGRPALRRPLGRRELGAAPGPVRGHGVPGACAGRTSPARSPPSW
jgi:hypothetical protein